MTLKQYLIFMIVATFIAWFVFGLVLLFIDPEKATLPSFLLFYASLFLALLGTLALVGFVVRAKLLRQDELILRQVLTSFRQGSLFAFLFTGALYLQSKSLLVWWNVLFFIFALTILEFFFMSFRRGR